MEIFCNVRDLRRYEKAIFNMSKPHSIDIDYVASLARLALTDDEKKLFSEQLGEVLTYMHKLDEVDVEGVEPMAHAFPAKNVWEEDKAAEPFPVEEKHEIGRAHV